jgi:protein-ribulosamine 3-kinase
MKPYPPILDGLGRGHPVRIVGAGGGCIADSQVAEFTDGSKVFVKCLEGVPGLFECEATGLRTLASADVIRVPEVLAVDQGALVLEFIESALNHQDFFESFGRSLARLHSVTGPCSGFSHDNFIGSTVQCNTPLSGHVEVFSQPDQRVGDGSDWPEFFLERRLRFQLKLAIDKGHSSDLERLLDRGEQQIKQVLSQAIESPCLLHGDLWGGNFMVDEKGEACLIDPAVYYGHRETDLAMTELFGGFHAHFYDSYNEQLPLVPGYEKRRPLYQLYHLLNHLNLFGNSYYSQCLRILQQY